MSNKLDKPAAKPVMVRLKPEVHQQVHELAEQEERSANWMINHLLAKALAEAAIQNGQGAKQ